VPVVCALRVRTAILNKILWRTGTSVVAGVDLLLLWKLRS